eukprot:scaffold437_cov168-Ochromonas_danica.AAC.58
MMTRMGEEVCVTHFGARGSLPSPLAALTIPLDGDGHGATHWPRPPARGQWQSSSWSERGRGRTRGFSALTLSLYLVVY